MEVTAMPGPPPKELAQGASYNPKKGKNNYIITELPAEGRQGPTPEWPFRGRPPKYWEHVWTLPQAVEWERIGAEDIVARYVKLRTLVYRASLDEVKSSYLTELRYLEDSLGLTPKGMQSLRWRIARSDAEAESAPKRSSVRSRRARLRVVAEEASG